jgi:3-oxoacyl-[acyl-carrier-protein] synthase-1
VSDRVADSEVVVVGAGLLTAVGLSLAETAASVRSATARFSPTPMHDRLFEPFTLAVIEEDGLPPLEEAAAAAPSLTSRQIRMLRLATAPLRACVAMLPRHAPLPGLVLALPDTTTSIPLDGSAFLGHLARQAPDTFDPKYSLAGDVGRAGGLTAIDTATATVGSGQAPIMLAGGVDTFADLYVLATLDAEHRIKSSTCLDGFVPGEGAAFLLLATRKTAREFALAPLFALSRSHSGFEAGHLYSTEVYRGDGLAATIGGLLASGAASGAVAEVYSSMNGESHWGKEWSVAFLRNRPAFEETHGMHHPADCYGDLGAAAGPALVALAGSGIRAGYRRTPSLVYCSSDRGARAALVVSTA